MIILHDGHRYIYIIAYCTQTMLCHACCHDFHAFSIFFSFLSKSEMPTLLPFNPDMLFFILSYHSFPYLIFQAT